MDSMAQFSASFVMETGKLLDEFGALLLDNENARTLSPADIDRMFRILHTVKGSVGMMGLDAFSALTHALEGLFVQIRQSGAPDGDRARGLFDLMFEATDAMRGALDDYARDGAESRDFAALIEHVQAFQKGGDNLTLRVALSPDCAMESVRAYLIVTSLGGVCPSMTSYPPGLDIDEHVSEKIHNGGLYLRFPAAYEDAVRGALAADPYVQSVATADGFPTGDAAMASAAAPSAEAYAASASVDDPPSMEAPPSVEAPESASRKGDTPISSQPEKPEKPAQPVEASEAFTPAAPDSYVSVHLSKLEALQRMTDELLMRQDRLKREAGVDDASEAALRLERASDALRSAMVALRMTPVSALFQRLHRTAREAARRLGRDIEFVSSGADVEIDKSILDALSESLTQIVRNAAVHGVESVKERVAAGKPPTGRITVTARNAGTSVVLSVADDGRGIATDKVVEAARRAGVQPQGDAPGELLRLLLRAGVTTSDQPDEMSGRGMGLDVARAAIEALRGSISMETAAGVGTTFHVRIPQSLAVMDCLCLGSGESVFLLPSLDVYRLLRPQAEDWMLEPDGQRLLRFQGHCLRTHDLGALYGVRAGAADNAAGVVAVLEGEHSAVAVYADALLGSRRAAVKPLPALLNALGLRERGISGLTVLSEDQIGLILDAEALLRL